MAYEGVDAGGATGLFPQHPKTGDWATLKGRTLNPWLMQPLMSTAEGDSRHQAPNAIVGWDKSVVNTGLTRGGGTMAV